jgi:carbon-monoxide dehydrogenase large subunit
MSRQTIPGRPSSVGEPIKRREDPRLIRGLATYTGDVRLPGMLHAAFVRSDHGAGTIRRIDTKAANAMPGVAAVLTFDDLRGQVGRTPVGAEIPGLMNKVDYPLLADGRVLFAGHPIAVVIAEDPYSARDGAAAVTVEIEAAPAVVDVEAALRDDAPRVYKELANNVCLAIPMPNPETDRLFSEADCTLRFRLHNQRLAPLSMEGRAVVAHWEEGAGKLTVWSSTQAPHWVKQQIARCLGVPEIRVRSIAPEVGGGFGCKIPVYPEECVLAWASRRLRRPVKWVETRTENLLATSHGRGHVEHVEVAYQRDGRVLALRGKTLAEIGAYCSFYGPFIALATPSMICGCYDIKAVSWETLAIYTNTMATDAYRGAGRPEAAYIIEQVMDRVARSLGADPVAVRRRNFIPKERFPYTTPTGSTYDTGDYEASLDLALEIFGYERAKKERDAARGSGRCVGIGIATFTEVCGFGPSTQASPLVGAGTWETATVRVEPSGNVTVLTGVSPHGQGQETAFAQMTADAFGIDIDDVVVVHGDTDMVPHGTGTFGSRGIVVGGSALSMALEKIVAKAQRIAAHHLDTTPDGVEFSAGAFRVKGSERQLLFRDVASLAYLWNVPVPGEEPGLEAIARFEPTGTTYPFGAHLCRVEVDRDTGAVNIERYVAVDDCGRIINPLLADGQRLGGIVQGLGQALWEGVQYDGNGQLLSGSLMDYAAPRAHFFPRFELASTCTTTPLNPLGAKGIGELGTIGATPCVVSAVRDALSLHAGDELDMPLRPERVRAALLATKPGEAT